METILKLKDVIHRIAVWFAVNTLPKAGKQYVARPAPRPYLDTGEVAAKADLYGESIDAEEMVRYVNRYLNLCAYLVADGYGITNILFRTRIRIPGEYDGNETDMPEGEYPVPRMNASPAFQAYIREHVTLEFKGIDERSGHMFTFLDEASGTDTGITRGNLFHIHGTGLKVKHDDKPEHIDKVGLWFVLAADPAVRLRAAALATNKPSTVTALVPAGLVAGFEYYIEIITQSNIRNNGYMLKNTRTVRSGYNFRCLS